MQKLIDVFAALEAYLHAHGSECSLCVLTISFKLPIQN